VHEEFHVRPQALDVMPALARHYGEPFADPSAIATFQLAQLTRRHVTVALNGDGGDESFAGYGRHLHSLRLRRLDRGPASVRRWAGAALGRLDRPVARIGHFARVAAAEPWRRYAWGMSAWDEPRRRAIVTSEFAHAAAEGPGPEHRYHKVWHANEHLAPVDQLLAVDLETYLPGDLLPKVDIATMAHSLEARSPFLDHVLMEAAAALPAEWKLDAAGTGKRILRDALRGIVPGEVLDRPKMGFGVPLSDWFRNELRDLPAERLLDRSFRDLGWLDARAVERTIAAHRSGRADHGLRLWVLLQLECWQREVLRAPLYTPAAR